MNPLDDERWVRMAWARLAEPEDRVAASLIERFGRSEALELLLGGAAQARHPQAQRFAARVKDFSLERDLEQTHRCHSRVVIPGDQEWPAALDELESPPHCVWVRGPADLAALSERSVAIVGSRAATGYGQEQAAELAIGLGQRGFTVVSGAAYGIDAAAHRGALVAKAPTIAVLPCGLERCYPQGHTELLTQVRGSGLLVSELPPGSAAIRTRFLRRNRIIAALTSGTVVVEAGLRSGALNTAAHATKLGRPLAAFPGPVTSAASAGCHESIRSGAATLVTDAAEVAELVGKMGQHLLDRKRGPARPTDELGSAAAHVWATLPVQRSMEVDELSRCAGLAASEVLSALGELEAAGAAERRLDGWGRAS